MGVTTKRLNKLGQKKRGTFFSARKLFRLPPSDKLSELAMQGPAAVFIIFKGKCRLLGR